MPHLISTPEAWFREKQTSFFQIDFDISYDEYSKLGEKGWKRLFKAETSSMNAWLEKFMPNVEWVVLGPSEYSGWIEGGPALNSAVLHDKQVHLFKGQWGKHPYWRLVERRFEDWRANLDRFVLWDEVSTLGRRTGWADVPGHGLVALVASAENDLEISAGALSVEDLYCRISELLGMSMDELLNFAPTGTYYKDDGHTIVMSSPRHDHWLSDDSSYWDPRRYVAEEDQISALMQFFKMDIPRNALIVHDSEF